MMDDDGALVDPDGLGYDLEVARGLASTHISKRLAAERIWKAIAAGKADSATMVCWIEHVAEKICSNIINNDDLDDRRRGSEALIAIGIYGKEDNYREMRAFIDTWLDFGEIARSEGLLKLELTPKMIVQACRSQGFIDDVETRAANEIARRQLKLVLEARAQR